MGEREALILKVTEIATKEAKSKKMNEAQTKVYVDSEIQKALEDYNAKLQDIVKSQNEKAQTTVDKTSSVITDIAVKQDKEQMKKYIVYTPVKNFCGEVAGVQFAYGKAEVRTGWILNWFREHGYKVEEVSE